MKALSAEENPEANGECAEAEPVTEVASDETIVISEDAETAEQPEQHGEESIDAELDAVVGFSGQSQLPERRSLKSATCQQWQQPNGILQA